MRFRSRLIAVWVTIPFTVVTHVSRHRAFSIEETGDVPKVHTSYYITLTRTLEYAKPGLLLQQSIAPLYTNVQ
jgi:hypothetical protein